jgi:hypothetical protein
MAIKIRSHVNTGRRFVILVPLHADHFDEARAFQDR